MGCFRDSKPTIAMLVLQFIYAAMILSTRTALTKGMSPRVFVVYRQAIATLFVAPIAYISYRVTIDQYWYLQGIYLTSSSIASAMSILLSAITFVMAAALGLEKVNIRSSRSIAKVLGTIICVLGASSMALLKGHKLQNMESSVANFIFSSRGENWVLGCLYLFGSCCCWSFWLILQVPMYEIYPHHLSLSAWMCFFAALQSGILTYFLEPNPRAWNLSSSIENLTCFYSGIIGSGVSICIQTWCISRRGPLFSAMFSPLSTVIVTILACLLLHEELYIGSLGGAIAVVAGLYAVLWGKAKDLEIRGEISPGDDSIRIQFIADEAQSCKINLKEPLLVDKFPDGESSQTNH